MSRKSLFGLVVLVLAVTAASQWWSGRHEAQLGEQVAALARPGDVHMLSSDSCGICVVARQWFKQHQVPFTECSIERDPACRAAFDATRAPGTPVLVVRGRTLVGFNPERVLAGLQLPR
jgi:glutaredoxin